MNDFEKRENPGGGRDSSNKYGVGKILILTLLGIASWELAALIFQFAILPAFPALELRGLFPSLPIITFIASLLFGITTKSLKLTIRGALVSLLGIILASYIGIVLTFMFFHNEVMGPYGNISIVVFMSMVFSPFYGAAVHGKKAVRIFFLVGLLASFPFGIILLLMSNGSIPISEENYFIFNPMVLALGTSVGLASGLFRAQINQSSENHFDSTKE